MERTEPLKNVLAIQEKVSRVFQKRLALAFDHFAQRIGKVLERSPVAMGEALMQPWEHGRNWWEYSVDLAQRFVLFWDTLRQRGDNFLAHENAGKPPVLHFEYEPVLDGRTFERPVNYALVRIIPPC